MLALFARHASKLPNDAAVWCGLFRHSGYVLLNFSADWAGGEGLVGKTSLAAVAVGSHAHFTLQAIVLPCKGLCFFATQWHVRYRGNTNQVA